MTTVKCLLANKMTMPHHVRHSFAPFDKTIKKLLISCNNLLNATIQSHPIKMDCSNLTEKCLIATTINPICRSCPVHHGTKL